MNQPNTFRAHDSNQSNEIRPKIDSSIIEKLMVYVEKTLDTKLNCIENLIKKNKKNLRVAKKKFFEVERRVMEEKRQVMGSNLLSDDIKFFFNLVKAKDDDKIVKGLDIKDGRPSPRFGFKGPSYTTKRNLSALKQRRKSSVSQRKVQRVTRTPELTKKNFRSKKPRKSVNISKKTKRNPAATNLETDSGRSKERKSRRRTPNPVQKKANLSRTRTNNKKSVIQPKNRKRTPLKSRSRPRKQGPRRQVNQNQAKQDRSAERPLKRWEMLYNMSKKDKTQNEPESAQETQESPIEKVQQTVSDPRADHKLEARRKEAKAKNNSSRARSSRNSLASTVNKEIMVPSLDSMNQSVCDKNISMESTKKKKKGAVRDDYFLDETRSPAKKLWKERTLRRTARPDIIEGGLPQNVSESDSRILQREDYTAEQSYNKIKYSESLDSHLMSASQNRHPNNQNSCEGDQDHRNPLFGQSDLPSVTKKRTKKTGKRPKLRQSGDELSPLDEIKNFMVVMKPKESLKIFDPANLPSENQKETSQNMKLQDRQAQKVKERRVGINFQFTKTLPGNQSNDIYDLNQPAHSEYLHMKTAERSNLESLENYNTDRPNIKSPIRQQRDQHPLLAFKQHFDGIPEQKGEEDAGNTERLLNADVGFGIDESFSKGITGKHLIDDMVNIGGQEDPFGTLELEKDPEILKDDEVKETKAEDTMWREIGAERIKVVKMLETDLKSTDRNEISEFSSAENIFKHYQSSVKEDFTEGMDGLFTSKTRFDSEVNFIKAESEMMKNNILVSQQRFKSHEADQIEAKAVPGHSEIPSLKCNIVEKKTIDAKYFSNFMSFRESQNSKNHDSNFANDTITSNKFEGETSSILHNPLAVCSKADASSQGDILSALDMIKEVHNSSSTTLSISHSTQSRILKNKMLRTKKHSSSTRFQPCQNRQKGKGRPGHLSEFENNSMKLVPIDKTRSYFEDEQNKENDTNAGNLMLKQDNSASLIFNCRKEKFIILEEESSCHDKSASNKTLTPHHSHLLSSASVSTQNVKKNIKQSKDISFRAKKMTEDIIKNLKAQGSSEIKQEEIIKSVKLLLSMSPEVQNQLLGGGLFKQ